MKKRICSLFFVLLLSQFAFANESFTQKQDIKLKNSSVTITTTGTDHAIDMRCYPHSYIEVEENQAGLIEDGKSIYFRVDQGVGPNTAGEVSGMKENLKIKGEGDYKTGVFKLNITRSDYNSKEYFKLDVSDFYFTFDTLGDQDVKAFSLWLITGNEYKDNLFYRDSDEKEEILLNERFLVLLREPNSVDKKQIFSPNQNSKITITVGKEAVKSGETTILTNYPSYIDENGRLMMSVYMAENLLSESGSIKWNESNGTVIIAYGSRITSMKTGEDRLTVNGTQIPADLPVVMKDGVFYIPIRQFCYAIGLEDQNINWNTETATVTIDPTL